MALPKRRPVVKSGILRGPKREWPRHRRWVRSHDCCVPGCPDRNIVFAHVRTAANAGTGIKPADWHGVSLCDAHHQESHLIGVQSFERKYGLDLERLAAAFAQASPDLAMKESLRNDR